MRKIICLAVLVVRFAAAGTANFRDFRNYLVGGTPEAAAVADVNKDGIPDVIVATFGGAAVLLGRNHGLYDGAVMVGRSAELSLAVADFNNDGNPDIAATILTNGTQISLAFGRGDGAFLDPQVLPILCVDCFLAAADFNGDGNMDPAVASTFSTTVFLGNGHGGFRGGLPAYPASFTVAVAAGDLNKDRLPDLVISDFGAGTLIVLLGNGDGSFQRADYPNGTEPYQAAIGDFNDDGLADLVAPDRQANTVVVRLIQGGGVFGPAESYPAGCSPFGVRTCTLEGVATGDFDKDGKTDLATPGAILHGNGDGTFQSPAVFYAGSQPISVASADLNRDGWSDIVVCDASATNVSILFGDRAFGAPASPGGRRNLSESRRRGRLQRRQQSGLCRRCGRR